MTNDSLIHSIKQAVYAKTLTHMTDGGGNLWIDSKELYSLIRQRQQAPSQERKWQIRCMTKAQYDVAQAAIAAMSQPVMGDVSTREDEGSIKPRDSAISDHVNDKDVVKIPSEISVILTSNIASVIDNKAKYYHAEVGDRLRNINDLADSIFLEIKPHLRTVEPEIYDARYWKNEAFRLIDKLKVYNNPDFANFECVCGHKWIGACLLFKCNKCNPPPKPVSVSLKTTLFNINEGFGSISDYMTNEQVIQEVLDAAGVTYGA